MHKNCEFVIVSIKIEIYFIKSQFFNFKIIILKNN